MLPPKDSEIDENLSSNRPGHTWSRTVTEPLALGRKTTSGLRRGCRSFERSKDREDFVYQLRGHSLRHKHLPRVDPEPCA
jgi:hypothetical protein